VIKRSFFYLFLALPLLTWGDDRTVPLDVYIIVDGSSALNRGKEEAIFWLCKKIDDLRQGDRLRIWRAGEEAELVYSGVLGDGREEVKTLVRTIKCEGNEADYRGALREARDLTEEGGERLSYTLLISGSGARREAAPAELLRHSRVESFSGWMVLTVGLNLSPKVRQALVDYMSGR
jgi:hypothetical protein